MTERAWAGTTYGTGWMHRWLIAVLRWMDIRLLYIFSSIFVVGGWFNMGYDDRHSLSWDTEPVHQVSLSSRGR